MFVSTITSKIWMRCTITFYTLYIITCALSDKMIGHISLLFSCFLFNSTNQHCSTFSWVFLSFLINLFLTSFIHSFLPISFIFLISSSEFSGAHSCHKHCLLQSINMHLFFKFFFSFILFPLHYM